MRQSKCYRFFWGGCQGNGNKFETKEDCEKYCYLNRTLSHCKFVQIHYKSLILFSLFLYTNEFSPPSTYILFVHLQMTNISHQIVWIFIRKCLNRTEIVKNLVGSFKYYVNTEGGGLCFAYYCSAIFIYLFLFFFYLQNLVINLLQANMATYKQK